MPGIPADTVHEMRTLCEALVLQGTGKYKAVCDVLAQRLLALEAQFTGHRSLARGLELVDTAEIGLASREQLSHAKRTLMERARIQQAGDSLRRR